MKINKSGKKKKVLIYFSAKYSTSSLNCFDIIENMLWKSCNRLTGEQTWWRSGGNGDECSGSAGDRRTSTDGGGSIVSTCNIIKKNQDKQKRE